MQIIITIVYQKAKKRKITIIIMNPQGKKPLEVSEN